MDIKNVSADPYHCAAGTIFAGQNTVGMLALNDTLKTAILANHPSRFAEYQAADVAADEADALVTSTLLAKTRLNAQAVEAAVLVAANQAILDASDAADSAYDDAVAAAAITTAARTC